MGLVQVLKKKKMPQGRKKTPFSGKAKREQLQFKKHSKTPQFLTSGSNYIPKKGAILLKTDRPDTEGSNCGGSRDTIKVNYQPSSSRNVNRYALQFHRETDEEIKQRKEQARHALKTISGVSLEIDSNTFFCEGLEFPKRPKWRYEQSVEALNSAEYRYFTEYIANIEKKFISSNLSYFELNLETWRQLWRVVEMSDIILLIVDIRFPALMFPPSFYDYITNTLKKQMILVLNKIDLVIPSVVVAWKHYFQEKYPELHIVMFTTVPSYSLHGKQIDKAGLLIRRRKGRARMAAEATQQLLDTCKKIVANQVDLSSWELKISEELQEDIKDVSTTDQEAEVETKVIVSKPDTAFYEHENYKDGILTIGCIGQPNVGKSSLLNAVMGRKVVSVSRTPGHTKHFQTIYITDTVRFCDCPGLVFPSQVPKPLQVLMGSFPIAQLREPFSTVQFIAERVDLPKLLRVTHPENDEVWTAMDVCDSWAKKNGFVTAKAGRLDGYRAANSLLRMALDGKICFNLYPPNYFESLEHWSSHADVEIVKWIQALKEESEDMQAIKESDHEIYSDSEESDSTCNSDTEIQNKFSILSNAND